MSCLDSKELEILWEGYIPTEISVYTNDITHHEQPGAYYIMLPRIGNLNMILDDVIDHFRPMVVELEHPPLWLEYNNIELKSTIPVGCLFDICEVSMLPWKLCLHFSGKPKYTTIKMNDVENSSSARHHTHNIKQAIYLLFGSTRIFTMLTMQQHSDLITSVKTGNSALYKSVVDVISSQVATPRLVPVRLITSDMKLHQRPFPCYVKETSEVDGVKRYMTLKDAIFSFFPAMDEDSLSRCKILIQGISIPLEAPLHYVWKLTCYPDLFVYMVLLVNPASTTGSSTKN